MDQNQENKTQEKTKKSFFKTYNEAAGRHINFDDSQMNRFIKTTGIILLTLLSIFVFVKTINTIKEYSTIGEAPTTPYVITVSGKGEVVAVKDLTVLSFSSFGKGATASEAQSAAAEGNNKAIAFLKSKGIDAKDISTESYNTNPTYDQKVKPCIIDVSSVSATPDAAPAKLIAPTAPCNSYEQVITGYETTQYIRVKIRGIDKNTNLSSEIVTGLGEAGVRVGNLDSQVDNPDALKAQARAVAIAQAREEADMIAKSLGVRLGKVVSFNENDYAYPMAADAMYGGTRMEKAVAPELPVGEGKITSNVSVSYEIR